MASAVQLQTLGNGVLWDALGIPLNGHQVYVYQRGTTTQIQVWQDSALTVRLSQPLTTGSGGASPGGIPGYVAGEQATDFYDATVSLRVFAEPISAADVPSSAVSATSPHAEQLFGVMEFYSHSLTYGGSSDQTTRGSDGRLAAMFHAEDRNRTRGGAILACHEVSPFSTGGNGGWAHIYRWTEQDLWPGFSQTVETGYELAGFQEPKRDYAQVWFGNNDIAKLGPGSTNLTPFSNALAAAISRLRMSDLFEDSDATVAYTGAGWAQVAGGTEPTKYQSGSTFQQTPTGGQSLTVTVPSVFNGGTVVLAFLSGPTGQGALWNFTVDGGAAGSLDTRNVEAKDYITAANPFYTPVIMRFTGLAAGAHTIVATATTVNSEAIFDCWWIEARVSPLIVVPNAIRPPAYTEWSGSPYTPVDADIPTLNTVIQGVVAQFDSDVVYIDIDSALNKNSTYFVSDSTHPNDEGHALVAQTIATAVAQQARALSKHSAGTAEMPGISRNPWTAWRNIIQAAQPDQCPLTLYGRNAGDQTGALLQVGRSVSNGPDYAVYLPTVAGQLFSSTLAGDLVLVTSHTSGNSMWFVFTSNVPTLQLSSFGMTSPVAALFQGSSASSVPLVVQGAVSQSADLQDWKNSSGGVLAQVTSAGGFSTVSYVVAGQGMDATAASATNQALILHAAAAQSGDILQIKNSSAAVLLNVTAAGLIAQYEYAFAAWKTLQQVFGWALMPSTTTNQNYVVSSVGGTVAVGGGSSATAAFYLNPADYGAGSRTVYVRIRCVCVTNAVAPTVSFTAALYPIATFGGASGSNPTIATLGASVCSVTFTTPGAANGGAVAVSSAVTFPAAGFYALVITPSGAPAANSVTQLVPTIQYQQV